MAKFHVNDKGEAGPCNAEQGGCPFGGEDRHYSSPEIARQAYELSNAAQVVPVAEKKVRKRDRHKDVKSMIQVGVNRDNFNSEEFGGFDYDDVVYNDDKKLEEYKTKGFSDVRAQELLVSRRKHWDNQANIEKPEIGKSSPIRSLPTGTKVAMMTFKNGYRTPVDTTIGTPVVNDDGSVVGRYRDVAGNWDYVDANTPFEVTSIVQDKKVSPRWNDENKKAQNLSNARGKAANINKYVEPEDKHVLKYGFKQSDLDYEVASKGQTGDEFARMRDRKKWLDKARTTPATEFENDVPMRLIPVGSQVQVRNNEYSASDSAVENATVEEPMIDSHGKAVGRYRLSNGDVRIAGGKETFHTSQVTSGGRMSLKWDDQNREAAKLKSKRRYYNLDLMEDEIEEAKRQQS